MVKFWAGAFLPLFFFSQSALARQIQEEWKIRQCTDGELEYQRVVGISEDAVTFYMHSTASNEADCVRMCYERLQFCNSVKFQQETGQDGGTCYFAYYRSDCSHTVPSSGGLVDVRAASVTSATPSNIFGCIRCEPFRPSFVQELEDNNNIGPALLIQNVVTTGRPDDSSANEPSNGQSNHLSYREYKTFNFLLPECTGYLVFSGQPTLMRTKPSVYTAAMGINSRSACAQLCFRQHFCVSAIWRKTEAECLLSYEKGSCAGGTVPHGYEGDVYISCIKCEEIETRK